MEIKSTYLALVLVFITCTNEITNTIIHTTEYSGIIFDENYNVKFSENEIISIINFISSDTNLSGWTPSISDIKSFELKLSELNLEKLNRKKWFRQYVGYEIHGKKYIWINFINEELVEIEELKTMPIAVDSLEEQQFILIYDVDKNEITS